MPRGQRCERQSFCAMSMLSMGANGKDWPLHFMPQSMWIHGRCRCSLASAFQHASS
jgi:hypothetical protein